jgi:hypothetical protein
MTRAEFVIGTVSHCHGALTRLVIPAHERERFPRPLDSD